MRADDTGGSLDHSCFDVCNGDADGLCAVLQWRLHAPAPARLITGLKRDIALLKRVQAHRGDHVLVCDLSMQRNLAALLRLLTEGVFVHYFDHHQIDCIPVHPRLQAHIDFAGNTCSSLLMDAHLGGQFRAWALVGAFGDNLRSVARPLAAGLGLSKENLLRLQDLGEAINYNAYGDSAEDVYIAPEKLFDTMRKYADPLVFLDQETIGQALQTRRASDMQQAQSVRPLHHNPRAAVYALPDAPWSRRVMGSMGNALAHAAPTQAHALLKPTQAGGLVVSLRAPMAAPVGAAQFCRRFGGDGRAGAAGIDHLPAAQMQAFIDAFLAAPWGTKG